MADVTITGLTALTSVDRAADYFEIADASDSNNSKRTTVNSMLDLASHPVGVDDTQTLTNKTITTPTLTVNDDSFTLQDNSDTTKKLQFQLSGITTATTRTLTIPNVSDTLVTLTASQTLTNKTLTSPTITSATISNPTLTVDTVSEYTSANGVTVDGVLLKDAGVTATGNLAVTGTSTLTGAVATAGTVSVRTGTATPAGGATTSGVKFGTTSNFGIFWGSGAPTLTAAQGSIYLRSDGSSTSTRLYVNTTGASTWTNFTSAT